MAMDIINSSTAIPPRCKYAIQASETPLPVTPSQR